MYFFPCKEWKIIGLYNCLRSPYFVGDVGQLLSHIAESLMIRHFSLHLRLGIILENICLFQIDFEMG